MEAEGNAPRHFGYTDRPSPNIARIEHHEVAAVLGAAIDQRDDPAIAFRRVGRARHEDRLARDVAVRECVNRSLPRLHVDLSDAVESAEAPATGHLEVVYHLYSMELKHGPVILRMRTQDRATRVHLPSLISVWRSVDFQEREVFDLFGVIFDGHPDLRRILMWDEFTDFPMRRDYVEPDDYEYEPTAHDKVLLKTTQHHGGTA